MKPKKYRAKTLNGEWVSGWYVELHIPRFDPDVPNFLTGFDVIPSLFNDEKGERSKGSYWNTIDQTTLQEVEEQLKFPFTYSN